MTPGLLPDKKKLAQIRDLSEDFTNLYCEKPMLMKALYEILSTRSAVIYDTNNYEKSYQGHYGCLKAANIYKTVNSIVYVVYLPCYKLAAYNPYPLGITYPHIFSEEYCYEHVFGLFRNMLYLKGFLRNINADWVFYQRAGIPIDWETQCFINRLIANIKKHAIDFRQRLIALLNDPKEVHTEVLIHNTRGYYE